MNVNLNTGGILGGVLMVCVGVGMMFLSNNPAFHDHMANLVVIGVICGALVGNIGWYLVFGKKGAKAQIEPVNDNMTACPMCGAAMLKTQIRCSSCGERPKSSRDPA